MANSNSYQELVIHASSHDYPVIIGSNIISNPQRVRHYVTGKQAMIVTNHTVAPLYLHYLQSALDDIQCDVVILNDGEPFKNQQSLGLIYDHLIAKHHHRDTTLIALGGGIIGDMTGFAAATYQRGVRFLQVPTTLLAQVDASIGGKTAINHQHAKNMIGSFYQPSAVLMDLNTLKTLPLREFRAGLAEIIKCALLEGGVFFNQVYDGLNNGLDSNFCDDLPAIIAACCQVKARYVQVDERESGIRALLNLGHTIAHALETYTHYERWLHGEAVAMGLYCAALLSCHYAQMDRRYVHLIDELLTRAKLPSRIPKDIVFEEIYSLLLQDKKIKNDAMRFILIKALGDCYIEEQVTKAVLRDIFQEATE